MEYKHKGFVLWFTGLSAAGKTTVADAVFRELQTYRAQLERLDGDVVRKNLTKDLSFSKKDRDENIRRIGFVANLLSRNGVGVVASFISPYQNQRLKLRQQVENYIEIFIDTPLKLCEIRDPKGMYKKARSGEIQAFTGVSDPYEVPENPDIHLQTNKMSVNESVREIISFLKEHGYIHDNKKKLLKND